MKMLSMFQPHHARRLPNTDTGAGCGRRLMDNTDTQFSGISLQHLIGIIELTIHAVGNIVRKSADKCIGQMLFYTIPSDL